MSALWLVAVVWAFGMGVLYGRATAPELPPPPRPARDRITPRTTRRRPENRCVLEGENAQRTVIE